MNTILLGHDWATVYVDKCRTRAALAIQDALQPALRSVSSPTGGQWDPLLASMTLADLRAMGTEQASKGAHHEGENQCACRSERRLSFYRVG
jgi:hypothetical protein